MGGKRNPATARVACVGVWKATRARAQVPRERRRLQVAALAASRLRLCSSVFSADFLARTCIIHIQIKDAQGTVPPSAGRFCAPSRPTVGTQGGMRTSGTLTHDLPGRQDLLAGAVAGGHRCGGDRAREPARRTQGARPRPRAACSRWQCGKPAKPSAHASHRSPVKFGRQ